MSSPLGRVLVVDDDPNVGDMLQDLLVEVGYLVKHAHDGTEALRLVPMFEPDVVLRDLQLPGMSGVEVLDRRRRDHPTVPVIIVTGNDDVEVARRMLRGGAFDYLSLGRAARHAVLGVTSPSGRVLMNRALGSNPVQPARARAWASSSR